jgi:hypothetical protein
MSLEESIASIIFLTKCLESYKKQSAMQNKQIKQQEENTYERGVPVRVIRYRL